MIPLMMQKDYAPKGWLGLILGTRLWYAMWDADQDDDAAFERRLSSVVREIADRGKLMVAEAVPPEPMPAPAPAPAQAPAPPAAASAPTAPVAQLARVPAPAATPTFTTAPAPAPAPAPAMVRAPNQTFSPTLHRTVPSVVEVERPSGGSSVMGGSLGELAAFMERQQCLQMEREDKMEAKLESQRLEAKAERAALEAKVESQRVALEAKVESQRVALEAKVESDRMAQHARLEEMRLASDNERRDKEVREQCLFQLP
jgi:hypothetical protein